MYIYILAWTCAYPCTEGRGRDEETTLKTQSLFRRLVSFQAGGNAFSSTLAALSSHFEHPGNVKTGPIGLPGAPGQA